MKSKLFGASATDAQELARGLESMKEEWIEQCAIAGVPINETSVSIALVPTPEPKWLRVRHEMERHTVEGILTLTYEEQPLADTEQAPRRLRGIHFI